MTVTRNRQPKAYLPPPPGIPQEEWDAMSRQRRYQLRREARGVCVNCGKEPIVRTRLGKRCLAAQRERMRIANGCVDRRVESALSYETVAQD